MTALFADFLTPSFVIPYLIGGMIAGFVTGLLGIGGGWLFLPLSLWVLSVNGYGDTALVPVAVGTSLVAVTVASISGAVNHARRQSFDAKLLRKWAPFVILGGLTGSVIAEAVPADVVKLIFTVIIFHNGIRMIRHKTRLEPLSSHWSVTGSIGYGIGLAASLIGIGGSMLATPVMQAMHVPLRQIIGTASALNICLALPAAVAYGIQGWDESSLPPLSVGYISLPALICIVPMTLIAVPFGVRASHVIDGVKLKRLFGLFLLLVALPIGYSVASG